jgi:hypothetical protein
VDNCVTADAERHYEIDVFVNLRQVSCLTFDIDVRVFDVRHRLSCLTFHIDDDDGRLHVERSVHVAVASGRHCRWV